MMQRKYLAVCLALVVLPSFSMGADVASASTDEVARDHGWGHPALSFDLTQIFLFGLGTTLLLLGLWALLQALSHKDDHGWGGAGGVGRSSRSLNLAAMSEKVLNGIDRMYHVYGKTQ